MRIDVLSKLGIAALVLAAVFTTSTASADDWPVRSLTYTLSSDAGWTPAKTSVPQGAEVNLTLKNASNAPACFEIKSDKGKFVKQPVCLRDGKEVKVTFFANHPKGTYTIVNAWQHQPAGTFTID